MLGGINQLLPAVHKVEHSWVCSRLDSKIAIKAGGRIPENTEEEKSVSREMKR
jgi:hypothetical protein